MARAIYWCPTNCDDDGQVRINIGSGTGFPCNLHKGHGTESSNEFELRITFEGDIDSENFSR